MNDMIELPYPEWQRPLQEVVIEFNREKLAQKALAAEALILERLRQLQQSNDGHQERLAINDGLSLLRSVKRDKLNYPDWR